MSDNTPFQSDPTQIIASDDVGGIKYQRVKITVGADGAATDVQPPDADGKAATTIGSNHPMLWNGTNFDRSRGNLEGTLLASLARTSSTQSPDQINFNARGVQVTLNLTAFTTAASLVLNIEAKEPIAGTYYTQTAAPTAVTATGLFVYVIYPGIGAASGGVTARTSGTLPRTWRVNITHGNGNSHTYSVGYALLI